MFCALPPACCLPQDLLLRCVATISLSSMPGGNAHEEPRSTGSPAVTFRVSCLQKAKARGGSMYSQAGVSARGTEIPRRRERRRSRSAMLKRQESGGNGTLPCGEVGKGNSSGCVWSRYRVAQSRRTTEGDCWPRVKKQRGADKPLIKNRRTMSPKFPSDFIEIDARFFRHAPIPPYRATPPRESRKE